MKIKNGFILRQMSGSAQGTYIVVAVGEASEKLTGYLTLNETGAFLWKFLTAEHTVEEGVQELLAEYEVEEELARKDVETFVNTILENGFAE